MTEPVIQAVESAAAPIVQAAVAAIAPEAKVLLGELHDYALDQLPKLEAVAEHLMQGAEHESAAFVQAIHAHVSGLVEHLHGILSIPAAVDPTSAPEAPTQS